MQCVYVQIKVKIVECELHIVKTQFQVFRSKTHCF